MRFWNRFKTKVDQPLVVTFTGGMGAQVISAAIYFAMKKAGQVVYADLSYFDQPEDVAQAGQAGRCSHWAWQLGLFGLVPAMFETSPTLDRRNSTYLLDGPEKLERALQALSDPSIRQYFQVSPSIDAVLPGWSNERFLCLHVRRGDYVNVASHLVHDETFISLARKFSGILDHVVVLSDSPIDGALRSCLEVSFAHASFQDQLNAEDTHRIMRKASVLICSNSQFSLIAAALNSEALALIPKQWFAGADRAIEVPLHARCVYQVLST